jgi:hypothetical protein
MTTHRLYRWSSAWVEFAASSFGRSLGLGGGPMSWPATFVEPACGRRSRGVPHDARRACWPLVGCWPVEPHRLVIFSHSPVLHVAETLLRRKRHALLTTAGAISGGERCRTAAAPRGSAKRLAASGLACGNVEAWRQTTGPGRAIQRWCWGRAAGSAVRQDSACLLHLTRSRPLHLQVCHLAQKSCASEQRRDPISPLAPSYSAC